MASSVVVAAATIAPVSGVAGSGMVAEPPDRPAEPTREATRAWLTAITRAGSRLVAVGERGVVLLSDDDGRSWRQASVPVSVTLTAVQFTSATDGWAVGHSCVVLHSSDGGETWQSRLDGPTAARLAAEAAGSGASDLSYLAEDGPDKPFLALYFDDAASGFVVGAYGLAFRTGDGGVNWTAWSGRFDNSDGLHLYAIRRIGTALFAAGEQGFLARSTDGGDSFERLETPYRGSFFTLAAPAAGGFVIAGLRGNAYWSTDGGTTLSKSDVASPVSFSATAGLADGALLFVNQAGQMLVSRDGGRSMQPLAAPAGPPLTAVVETADGALAAATVRGATRLAQSAKVQP